MNHPGFHSVVRFCPDIDRGEAVNVGVIVARQGSACACAWQSGTST